MRPKPAFLKTQTRVSQASGQSPLEVNELVASPYIRENHLGRAFPEGADPDKLRVESWDALGRQSLVRLFDGLGRLRAQKA